MPSPDTRPLTGRLPRLALARLPTPLERAERLGAAVGVELWIEREDLSGLGLGGNKARQIEVLLADARARGADCVVTTAGSQSNFCRTLAAACAETGLACRLLLRKDGREGLGGNLLLDRLFGARIDWIATENPYDDAIEWRLEAIAEDERRAGRRPHVIRLPGAAGPLAAAAAVGLAEELVANWQAGRAPVPQAVYAPVGSGLSVAGLALGLQALRSTVPVIGISVQQPAAFIRPLMLRRIGEAAALLGIRAVFEERLLELDDGFVAPGYGRPSPASLDAVALAGRMAGLVLDPAYGGKALAALIAHVADGRLDPARPVLFVHTGGAPGLFAHAGVVSDRLAASGV